MVEQLFGDRGLTVDLAVIESSVLEHTVVGKVLIHLEMTVCYAVAETLVHSGMTVSSAVAGWTRFTAPEFECIFDIFVMVKHVFASFFCLYFNFSFNIL